ncbi:NADH-quinone oxidoreductase subunit H [Rubrivirga sp. SAORIC476]|uniref:NADH-quinone oxidoreductase subunit NuoH n=1 Tax=Rubrivirga sp. SAORIC476 TaxID=1961794 RepID=UPI000BA9C25A|nr:NADH-quinone oxidoreductase subunit NuoH [Rubrivirga sp. SAORIC476]MAQ96065.1 NADH-quinone oxidoreductase subunit NuoH [Rhodothermaceae bacterium]MBC15254.1 NADH-quinone oxidoreductase subunit NuoH [Rhodothermaceae bacterium]PAP79057.1 NADH-quinone oxidoreductase subunit H [Rubrivirga sp. SAORIC476]
MDVLLAIWEVLDLPIVIFLLLNFFLVTASLLVYAERKVSAFIQERSGPNRVGPAGLFQSFADVFKLMFKENIVPAQGNPFIHSLAPVLMVVIAMSTGALIPWAKTPAGDALAVADIGVGLLVVLAMTSVTVYGVTLAGWSSNSKYSLLGGLRSSAQMISYELAMGAAAISVVLYSGSLSLFDIVESQDHLGSFLGWNLFRNPVGFVVFSVCALAETNRAPFDLPEAEQELVGGYHTEYSGMKFGMFFLAEYVNLWIASLLITVLFLGGYLMPGQALLVEYVGLGGVALTLIGITMTLLKTMFIAFCFIWIRWTLPRFKYNQLMNLGWKYMLPIGIANILVIAALVAGWQLIVGS